MNDVMEYAITLMEDLKKKNWRFHFSDYGEYCVAEFMRSNPRVSSRGRDSSFELAVIEAAEKIGEITDE